MKKFRVLVADPPWPYADKLPGPARGAAKNYGTLSIDDVEDFELPPLEDDAALFLWRVAPMQEEAFRVMRAWGFRPQGGELVWRKLTKNGKLHPGMGRVVRHSHEVCLVGVRGRPVVLDKGVRSVFDAKLGRHSEKPAEFYSIVERLFAGPYAELFARIRRPGWTCFGDELP